MSDAADSNAETLSAILNVSQAEAAALLQQTGGDINVAATLYYAQMQDDNGGAPAGSGAAGDDDGDDDDDADFPKPQANPSFSVPTGGFSAAAAAASGASQEPRRTGMATLASLAAENGKRKDNELYAGGKQSGIAVQGGSDPMNRDAFLEAAKRLGVSYDDYVREEAEKKKNEATFKGLGYKLGDSTDQPVQTEGMPLEAQQASEPQIRKVKVTFWKGGFAVDDGENTPVLRKTEDPANAAFLAAMTIGRIPAELRALGEVDVELEDRHTEEFVPPKPRVKAFSGTGYRLGVPTPAVAGAGGSSAAASAASGEAASAAGAADTTPLPEADPSRPTTSIQFRLADGTRLLGTFNTDVTVGDLRRFVAAARPTGGRRFVLLAGFPTKELADDTLTVEQAGLLKGVVHQKFA